MQAGNGSRSESGSGMVMWGKYSFGGSYSESVGTAVLTSTGELRATPLGPLLTEDFILFNARSYAVSASTLVFRKLSVAGGYSKFNSSTQRGASGVTDNGSRYNLQTQYRLRKFSLLGGFNHTVQSVSTIAGRPKDATGYYFSILRWFNVF
jgi:hypothetical protein